MEHAERLARIRQKLAEVREGRVETFGAGPYYGFLPIERWNDALTADTLPADWLSRPCERSPRSGRDA